MRLCYIEEYGFFEGFSLPVTPHTLHSAADLPQDPFARLVAIMRMLRAPDGCPWDLEQNYDSLKKYLVEEAYEVIEAIDDRDFDQLAEELGDLMLQPVFLAQIAKEQGLFSITDSLNAINEKLIRRHPHIFGDGQAKTSDDVKKRWDEIKDQEKADKGKKTVGVLGGIPRSMPALTEAKEISKRAAKVGFDWENSGQVIAKLHEELDELARAESDAEKEGELGDLFFVLVNLARFHGVDPEEALRKTNSKFRQRFGHVEARLAEQGRAPETSTVAEMEEYWQEAKHKP